MLVSFILQVEPETQPKGPMVESEAQPQVEDLEKKKQKEERYGILMMGFATPANVTGALHIGHALTSAIQDTIIHRRRMSGYNMDHAGIATRDLRLVNWDCILRRLFGYQIEDTVKKVPAYEKPVEFGVLTSFAYPLEGGLGEIIVATTRVETMLGDTATAIHPDDPRYSHLHGKFAIHTIQWKKISYRMPRFTACEAVTAALQRKVDNTLEDQLPSKLDDGTKGLLDWVVKRIMAWVNPRISGKGLYRAVWPYKPLMLFFDEENRNMEIIPKQYAAEWKAMVGGTEFQHSMPYVMLKDDELKELGWPDVTDDLKAFYIQLQCLNWARHSLFLDPLKVINGIAVEGFQKRLEEGNLDPTELEVAKDGQRKDFPNVIPGCGADALRFALVSYTVQSDDINLNIQRVVGSIDNGAISCGVLCDLP
ncbi:valyl-tRNA synthetase [Actinidia rufa]|uniref:valine--tRNA ligase n=1 Tax=Actinidia rufa TaxID=165716 RepID=A0A7J0GWQ7_9ERIC|nr:valyl-tRNA synthetase [Actinidia rufa]